MVFKLATFIITLVINIAVGVAVFFFILLAMNGYSESDASYGLVAYIILAVLLSLLMSSAAALLTHMLIRREFRSAVAALLSIGLFSVVGIGLTIVCGAFGVAVAEFVRVNY